MRRSNTQIRRETLLAKRRAIAAGVTNAAAARKEGSGPRRVAVGHFPRSSRRARLPLEEIEMKVADYAVARSDEEWRKKLTPEQYHVMREHGTERAGSCALNYEKRAGAFSCAGCDQLLFVSKKKFESGTGWPS